jgi:hypothetical protein
MYSFSSPDWRRYKSMEALVYSVQCTFNHIPPSIHSIVKKTAGIWKDRIAHKHAAVHFTVAIDFFTTSGSEYLDLAVAELYQQGRWAGRPGSVPGEGTDSSLCHVSERTVGPTSLLYNGHRGQSGMGQKVTIIFYSCSYECFPSISPYVGNQDSSFSTATGRAGRHGLNSLQC